MPQLKAKRSSKVTLDNCQSSQTSIADLFAASKHKVVESSTDPPNKRLKRAHSKASDEPAEQVRPMTIKAQDMYTFNSTSPKRQTEVIDLTDTPNGSPTKYLQKRPINFSNHTGPKRLMVKNFKTAPRASPDQYVNQIWDRLEVALSAIFQGKNVSLEELYRGVENVCRQGKASILFERLCEKCTSHVSTNLKSSVMEGLDAAAGVDVLRAAIKAWMVWKEQLSKIRSIFYYMDRSYLLHSASQPSIEEMGHMRYRSNIFSDPQLKPKILLGACDLVTFDRQGDQEPFDGTLFRNAVAMFHTLSVYTREFEPKLLGVSQTFFRQWAATRCSKLSLANYVVECQTLIGKEMARCDIFNLEATTKRDLTAQLDKFLVEEHQTELVRSDEVAELMHQDKLESLSQVYSLLQRKGLGHKLRPAFELYINTQGSAIVFDEAREAEMVIRLLAFKKQLDSMWDHSFMKNEGLGHSLREAFESFINKTNKSNMTWGTDNPKPGEMIAKYVDMILRGGAKAIPTNLNSGPSTTSVVFEEDMDEDEVDEDLQINRQLDQVLDMFRFVHGKAVFEAFYKKDLARRLLMGRSASSDAEKNMLDRLKSECGAGFTHNLEQMFKDIELAREEHSSYKQMLEEREITVPVDMNVNVLSSAAWPTYPDMTVEVPFDVQRAATEFEKHYKMKHSGRKLVWKHALAHCQLKANFPKGNKEIVVSSFQAIVMLYFNDKAANESVPYSEIKLATSLNDEELKRTLQSLACAKYRVLTKSPKGKDVNETDTFAVNLGFTDPKYRIKINQIQLKETKQENKETHERVAADRHYETQAAIVRIMKSRKTIKHAELVAEVITATKSRGVLDPADIKKNIEKLIEKDYMEREEGNTYSYLA